MKLTSILATLALVLGVEAVANAQATTFDFTGSVAFQNQSTVNSLGLSGSGLERTVTFSIELDTSLSADLTGVDSTLQGCAGAVACQTFADADIAIYSLDSVTIRIDDTEWVSTTAATLTTKQVPSGNTLIDQPVVVGNRLQLTDYSAPDPNADTFRVWTDDAVSSNGTTLEANFFMNAANNTVLNGVQAPDSDDFVAFSDAGLAVGIFGRQQTADEFIVFPVTFVAGVPEPSTWIMLLAGFAVSGLALKRRARLAAA